MTSIRAKFRPARAVLASAGKTEVRMPAPARRFTADRLARQLALAHWVERAVESGEISSYADAARALNLTRARLTQVMNLLLLAPAVQQRILAGEIAATERRMRELVAEPDWAKQQRSSELGPVPTA